ncbi:4-carboxymuconolactone decarboxylase [Roseovarius pacificus]|uniref:4-carboxymuconolactone decarboxylase n=1 Tax=Roseovarius pacificus TaxID=337701 RepID=A0A1M6YAK4_9RHOB|nr:carboxymuconolactone decarboxylase family protein [Roseovarius pacificus]GGO51144.1 4-carboxymuconolactone decarboxylase [Roseovarius pacificus]SHL14979.1 4-carboxymuconolactone decarboxylase [Roseovarius pacificus]
MDEATYEKGLEIRRATLGDEYVDKALANADDFGRDYQELVTSYCWGEIWGREGLDRKTRSTINIAMIASLNRQHELAAHIRGAINNGLTPDDIKEILLQVGIYAGVPAMVDSFRVARTVLGEMDEI